MKITKRAASAAMALAVLTGSAAAIIPQVTDNTGMEVQAANSEADFYTSDNPDGTIAVTGYKGSSSTCNIPSQIYGQKVTAINGHKGFGNAVDVVIPNTVTQIGNMAFQNSKKLESVVIPNSVRSIGTYAFTGCEKLTSITLPKELDKNKGYGSYIFEDCKSLDNVTIPVGWTIIPEKIFNKCTSLKRVSISNTVNTISYGAFAGCNSLKSINIPGSVKNVQQSAFADCSSLEIINFSNGLEKIELWGFKNCSSLKELSFPKSLKTIDQSAFENCTSLTKAVFPSAETSIAYAAWYRHSFENCPNLTIYGKKNSGVNKYANNYNFKFVALIDATGVVLNTSGIALDTKETYQLKATIKPADATVNSVTWKSSNTGVAVVSSTGKVTAVNSGTASITATTANGKTAKCSVTVYGSPTSITLNKGQTSLGKGETLKLTATVGPQYAKDKSVKWRTSAPKIVTVDQKGNVKAVGNGTAWVTARTVNGKEKSCKITVKNAPSKVSMSKTALTVGVGETYKLSAVLPSGSASSVRTFRSSNNSIINMTKTNWEGQFKAMKTGTAWVTVRLYNGKEASCKITVKPAPKNVYVNKKTINMKVGQTAKVSAYLNSGAACATRTFRSSSPSIVKMTKTNWEGQFKAMKKGVAWVTVRTYNGKEASCKIVVS